MPDEQPYVREIREQLTHLVASFEQLAIRVNNMHETDKHLTGSLSDLTRRLDETERRAVEAERLVSELQDKADRGDRLTETGVKLIEALDRLPVSMDEATIVPGNRPLIDLYGTYEWQAVVDAKFHVKQELKERRTL